MLSKEKSEQISLLIDLLSEELDIPNSKYVEAENRYLAISNWLQRPESSIKNLSPDIYVQGSFRLGTVVNPSTSDGEYDIDCVCVLKLQKHQCTPKQLKDFVGNEIKLFAQSHSMQHPPKEGKRCWTLKYADGSKFHIDILPAIPYSEPFRTKLYEQGFHNIDTSDAIAITDKMLFDWKVSNPKGYAIWFKARMSAVSKSIFNESKELFDEFGNIENVPVYRIKTPLQKVVQILKKHRDFMFNDSDNKPISIIISTLSAIAYSNEQTVFDALVNIVKQMRGLIKNHGGKYYILNPVNPLENFADKWEHNKELEKAFFQWISELEKIVNEFESNYSGMDTFSETMKKLSPKDITNNVMTKYGRLILEKRENGTLKVDKNGLINSQSGTQIRKHTFHGK